jgi:hypothetical protein
VDRRSFLKGSVKGSAAVLAALAAGGSLREFLGSDVSALASPYRAFSDGSEWNRQLPVDAPIDPSSDAFIRALKGFDPLVQFPRLDDGPWSEPIYWAGEGDPEFSIPPLPFPVRIPTAAAPAPTSDAQLTVYDVNRGLVIKLQGAVFDGRTWQAGWTELYYLASNGLSGDLAESNDDRNRGHRGMPPPLHAVRWGEVRAGEIRHVLKVAVRRTAPAHVYPASADAGGSGIIPEGAVFRIKPGVDLVARGLQGAPLVIATAMQRYGVVVGDQAGVPMALKLKSMAATGRSQTWSDIGVYPKSLARVTFDDFECMKLGYHR